MKNFMKSKTIIYLLIFGGLLYWLYIQLDSSLHHAVKGKPAPDFTLRDEQDKKVALTDYQGKVVLLHFWATYCPPCIHELPSLNRFEKKLRGESFQLVAISEDKTVEEVQKFRKETVPFDFPFLLDPTEGVAFKYGVEGIPETFLINKKGIVVEKFVGPQNWDSPKWEKKIKKLIAESE